MTMSDPVSKGPSVTTVSAGGRDHQQASVSLEVCRRVAEKFVDDIITKATQEVSNISPIPTMKSNPEAGSKKVLQRLPTIQFDLVGPRSPSPEEENFPWIAARSPCSDNESDTNMNQRVISVIPEEGTATNVSSIENEKPKKKVRTVRMRYKSDDDEDELKGTSFGDGKGLDDHADIPDEDLKKLASRYVQDIVLKATEVAAQDSKLKANKSSKSIRTETKQPTSIRFERTEDEDKGADDDVFRRRVPSDQWGSWRTRIRSLVIHILRSTCICRPDSPEQEPTYL